MCHQKVRPSPRERHTASGDAAEEEATPRDTGPDPSAQQEEDLNQDDGSLPEMQSDAVTPDPAEQQEEIKSFEDGDCAREGKDKRDETQGEAVQGLRFSSSGDFVGFVSPCSSGGDAESHNTSLSNMHNEGEESGIDSPPPSTLERQSASYGAEREDRSSAFSPENRDLNKHNDCERTTRSCSLESNRNLEAFGVNSQTSVKSSNKNSEFLDCVEDPENHNGSSSCTRSEDSD